MMYTNTNFDVKAEAIKKGVRLYQIAQYCGISESCFNAHMRKPLSDAERQQFLEAIDAIANSKGE
jgi:uncharacterized tellurite resistance protein B-like protein